MKPKLVEPSDTDFAKWEVQLRKGSLGLAVLASLWEGRLYGLEMLRRLEGVAGMTVPEGTIYPLLNRLKIAGFVESEWVEADAGHPRKYYRLTAGGRSYVREIAATWLEFAAGMNTLLAPLEDKAHAKRKTT
jgi:PadR family transcriptional regulator, regulatory protein PadR